MALSDGELLALLLGQGRRGASALELAAELLADHGGIAGLAAARPEELARRTGVGSAKAAALIAAFHLGHRARAESAAAPPGTPPPHGAPRAPPQLARARREPPGGGLS
ncbi:UPF0758 domain-containing protein, partial [Nocardia farcinica]|uniref:UPF0758 domain-containing protein n=1 Tax=Nocardia farcinica TaxID=37329 RepID=UPI00313BE710